jgi:hypothetical protein
VHTWSIRPWVKIASIAGGAVFALAAYGLAREGTTSPAYLVLTAAATVGVPYLGLWPRIQISDDGTVDLRGCFARRRTTVTNIRSLSMTGYGLRFEFFDGQPFTSIVFQATSYRRFPRYVEVVHAVTGEWPEGLPHP